MKNNLWMAVLAGLCLAGCMEQRATRDGLIRRERESLKAYCTKDAHKAQAALIECERYISLCQRQGVSGVLFDQSFGRTYGRLYLVSKHLGKNDMAERYLGMAAEHYQKIMKTSTGAVVRQREIELMIEQELDRGMKVAWRAEEPDRLSPGGLPVAFGVVP